MNLQRILDVVVSRAVAIVVGVHATADLSRSGVNRRQGIAAQYVACGNACGTQLVILQLTRRIEAGSGRNAILARAHIKLSHHAHLQVLWRRDVAVKEVRSGIRSQVVIGEAGADVDCHRSIRHAVIKRRGIRIAVEVNRVLLEQVGAHDHAHVGQGEEEFVVFVNRHQRRRDVAVQDADVHDLARIDVAIETLGGSARRRIRTIRRLGQAIQVGRESHRAIEVELCQVQSGHGTGRVRAHGRGRITGLQGGRRQDVELVRKIRARLTTGDLRQTRQRAEGEHVSLSAVAHGGVAVTT